MIDYHQESDLWEILSDLEEWFEGDPIERTATEMLNGVKERLKDALVD